MKRALLLGAGAAHLRVLHAFAAQTLPGVELTLVAPAPRLLHAPMLAGFVAGHYTLAQCSVPLAPLAERAGARLLQASAASIDLAARSVSLADGRSLAYDALSLDLADAMDRDAIPGAREHGLFLRPLEAFAPLWERMHELADRQPMCVVVVGSGVEGVEMALALQHRLGERSRISLVSGGGPPLPGHPEPLRRRVLEALKRRQVTLLEDACAEITATRLTLASGTRVACDAAVMALPVCVPVWLRGAGLALDAQGLVVTGATLQSPMQPEVFAAGADPRAGVPLALNLRRFLAGGELVPWVPPARTLELIDCGERRALARWGGWAAQGRWVWQWKDHRDRRFLETHGADSA